MYVYVIIDYNSGAIEAVTKTLETAKDFLDAAFVDDPFADYHIVRKKIWDE